MQKMLFVNLKDFIDNKTINIMEIKISRIEIVHIDNNFVINSYDSNNELVDTTKCGSNIEDVFADIREFHNQHYF